MSQTTIMDQITTGFFAPFLKLEADYKLELNSTDWKKSILMGIVYPIFAWLCFGWLIVDKYRFGEFLRGDWNSPAKVFAYENNGLFMIYAIGLFLVLLWIFPSLLQTLLNRIAFGKGQSSPKLAFVTHAYSAGSFTLLFLPVIFVLIWQNPFSWRLEISVLGRLFVYIYFFVCVFYGYFSAMKRSSQQFGLPLRLSIWHLWIPILLIVAQFTIGIF